MGLVDPLGKTNEHFTNFYFLTLELDGNSVGSRGFLKWIYVQRKDLNIGKQMDLIRFIYDSWLISSLCCLYSWCTVFVR